MCRLSSELSAGIIYIFPGGACDRERQRRETDKVLNISCDGSRGKFPLVVVVVVVS